MRRLTLVFGLSVGIANAVHSQFCAAQVLAPNGGGIPFGAEGGPEMQTPSSEPTSEVPRAEIYLPETPPYVAERSRRTEFARRSLIEKLARPVSADIPEIPLGEAIREIAGQIEASVRIDVPSLTDSGVSADEVVALQADGVSAEEALRQLLEPHDLAAIVDGESLVVTTREIADDTLTARVYPVPDLVVGMRDGRRQADIGELTQVIMTTTGGLWTDIDGTGGSMAPFTSGGVHAIVVRQTYAVHREIEDLLHGLREARPEAARRSLAEPPDAEVDEAAGRLRGRLSKLRGKIERLNPTADVESLGSLRQRIESRIERLTPSIGEEVRDLLPLAEEPQPLKLPETPALPESPKDPEAP